MNTGHTGDGTLWGTFLKVPPLRSVQSFRFPVAAVPGMFMLVLLLALAPAAGAATIFKIATISPDGTAWMQRMRGAGEEIAKATDGRVRFKFYPGGVMGSDEAVLRKMRIGQLHGGAVTGGSLAAIDPATRLYGLPLQFSSFEEVDYVRARMDQAIIDSLGRKGLVSFGLADGGFAYVMSAEPVRSLDDLRARRVWVPANDEVSRALFETAGITPVSLPLSDVLTGLQTGLIDTIGSSPVGAIALQWYARVRYLTDTPLFYLFGTIVLDRKAFEKLRKPDQDTVRTTLGRALQEMDRQNRADHRGAREALRKNGIQFLSVAPDKLAELERVARATRERLARDRSVPPDMMKTLQTHLDAFHAQRPGR